MLEFRRSKPACLPKFCPHFLSLLLFWWEIKGDGDDNLPVTKTEWRRRGVDFPLVQLDLLILLPLPPERFVKISPSGRCVGGGFDPLCVAAGVKGEKATGFFPSTSHTETQKVFSVLYETRTYFVQWPAAESNKRNRKYHDDCNIFNLDLKMSLIYKSTQPRLLGPVI